MYDVFVSYSREDQKRVGELVEALISLRGWSVWWDEQLQTGSRFTREIETALIESRCVLVVWSEHSVQSDWVRAEADEGRKRGVLIPVRLDTCQLPLPFGQTETADLSTWKGSERTPELLELVEEIQRVMAAGVAPGADELVSREARQSALRRRRVIRYFMFAVILVTGLIGAGMGYLWYTQRADAQVLSKRLAGEADAVRKEVLTLSAEENKKDWWSLFFTDGERLDKIELSILLAIEAMRAAPTQAAEHALRQGLVHFPASDWRLALDDGWKYARALDFSHDGRFLAVSGGRDGTLIWDFSDAQDGKLIWDYRSGKRLIRIEHGGTRPFWKDTPEKEFAGRPYSIIDFSPVENLIATAGLDGTARLWDVPSGGELQRLHHEETVDVVQFSPDGQMLATASYDGTAKLWDTHSGKELVRLPHDDVVRWLEFSSSGSYVATASRSGITRVWSCATGEELARLDSENKTTRVRFGPDEEHVMLLDTYEEPTLWNWRSRQLVWRLPIQHLPRYRSTATDVVFDPTGDRVFIGETKGELSWWDTDRREFLFSVKTGVAPRAMSASPDRNRIVFRSGSVAQAWDLSAGRELKRMPYKDHPRKVTISPDGELLASGGTIGIEFEDEHRIHFNYKRWNILEVTKIWPEDPVATACNRLRHNMTRNQWRDYMWDQPYRLTCPQIKEP